MIGYVTGLGLAGGESASPNGDIASAVSGEQVAGALVGHDNEAVFSGGSVGSSIGTGRGVVFRSFAASANDADLGNSLTDELVGTGGGTYHEMVGGGVAYSHAPSAVGPWVDWGGDEVVPDGGGILGSRTEWSDMAHSQSEVVSDFTGIIGGGRQLNIADCSVIGPDIDDPRGQKASPEGPAMAVAAVSSEVEAILSGGAIGEEAVSGLFESSEAYVTAKGVPAAGGDLTRCQG